MVQATREAILRLLLHRHGPDGLRLKDLTEELRLSNAAALYHLGMLQAEGFLDTKQEGPWGRGTRYWAKPMFRGVWIDPASKRLHRLEDGPLDWRFPLISRVRDAKAREFLHRWLDALQAEGALPRMRSKYRKELAKGPLLQLVVYGSCARGDASSNSDVDVLIYTDMPKRAAQALVDAAHGSYEGTGRTPDVRIIDPKAWREAEAAFRANVARDGCTVYSNDPALRFLEDTVEGP